MESQSLILLDTQIVVWMNRQQDKLSRKALEIVTEARRGGAGLAIADITLWEIAMGVSKDRIQLALPPSAVLEQVASLYKVLPITPKVADTSITLLKSSNSDPADRLIAATALVHGIPLVTSDRRIRDSGEVPTIW